MITKLLRDSSSHRPMCLCFVPLWEKDTGSCHLGQSTRSAWLACVPLALFWICFGVFSNNMRVHNQSIMIYKIFTYIFCTQHYCHLFILGATQLTFPCTMILLTLLLNFRSCSCYCFKALWNWINLYFNKNVFFLRHLVTSLIEISTQLKRKSKTMMLVMNESFMLSLLCNLVFTNYVFSVFAWILT